MLVLRQSQIEVFEQIAVKRFEEGLLKHIHTFFPQHAVVLCEKQLQRLVRYGLERAERRRLQTERSLFLYVALMFMLGSRFDEDLQYPWALWQVEIDAKKAGTHLEVAETEAAASVSTAPDTAAERGKERDTADVWIERVYGEAMRFLDQAVGLNNEFLQQALRFLQQPRIFDDLPSTPSFGHRLLALLQMLLPKKYQLFNEDQLRQLVRYGYEGAKAHGISSERGIMNYLALVFLLGSHFDRDPLYPWATTLLAESESTDPLQKEKTLREAALQYLRHCLPGCPRRAEQSAVALAKPVESYRRIIEQSRTIS